MRKSTYSLQPIRASRERVTHADRIASHRRFYKLFVTYLEERFAKSPNPFVQRLIHDQFVGKYAYVTRCAKCGNESATVSAFYELEIIISKVRAVRRLDSTRLAGPKNRRRCSRECRLLADTLNDRTRLAAASITLSPRNS